MTIGLLPFVVDSVKPCTDGGQSKTDLRHLRMCRVRTRSKREASSQNLTRKTSHMLKIPYNFLNGFELISKMTCGTSQSAEIRRSAEKSHVWALQKHHSLSSLFHTAQHNTASLFVPGQTHRLVGLVVKASASRAEGPGFESHLRRDFFGVESYQWLQKIGTPVATLPGALAL